MDQKQFKRHTLSLRYYWAGEGGGVGTRQESAVGELRSQQKGSSYIKRVDVRVYVWIYMYTNMYVYICVFFIYILAYMQMEL